MNNKDFEQMQEVFYHLGQVLSDYVEAIMPLMQKVYDSLYQKYIEEGAVYGESQKGFIHWLNDIDEINHHQRAIEEIKTRHWIIASTKQMLTNLKTEEDDTT